MLQSRHLGVAAGDLNGDGRPDLVASNFGDDTISIALQDSPAPPQVVPEAPLPLLVPLAAVGLLVLTNRYRGRTPTG